MNAEQKKVVLDYATELQSNDEPWREFEFNTVCGGWAPCTRSENPIVRSHQNFIFRRKPRTITVTMPVPYACCAAGSNSLNTNFHTTEDRDTALAAIREAMKDE